MKPLLITIDGPAGAGKTTVSKALADRLSYTYVDTGALYRGVALAAKSAGISIDNIMELEKLCSTLELKFVRSEKGVRLMSGDSDISEHIRTPEITMMASDVSAVPLVRTFLLKIQRDMARKKGVIFEGRDMGTVVFPDADIKFFLDAPPDIRALRRYKELRQKNPQTFEQVEKAIRLRDKNDSTREIAPLKPADDAVIVNSANISLVQVAEQMLSFIKKIQISST